MITGTDEKYLEYTIVKPSESVRFTPGPSPFSSQDLLGYSIPTALIFIPVISPFLYNPSEPNSSRVVSKHNPTPSIERITHEVHVAKSNGHFAVLILLGLYNGQLSFLIVSY